ncbi:ATPase with role in protein import into the ER [Tulasnella sp. 408]|nr:ATPase with role in protein import into the ER [Tulasnella sp. 408]
MTTTLPVPIAYGLDKQGTGKCDVLTFDPGGEAFDEDILEDKTAAGDPILVTPEETFAMVLGRIKQAGETYLGEKVTHAVVTVLRPPQRHPASATKDAGTLAGLTILRIGNERTNAPSPTKNSHGANGFHIIVYGLGGGTSDVPLLTIDNGVFGVLATAGDTHLGGEDSVNHFLQDFKRRLKKDFSSNAHALVSAVLPLATTAHSRSFLSKSSATFPTSERRSASRSPPPVPPKKRRLKPPPSPVTSPTRAPPGTQHSSSRPKPRDPASSSSSSSRKALSDSPARASTTDEAA